MKIKITLLLSMQDVKDLIESINMAENEGIYNDASEKLKTRLERILKIEE